MISRTAGFNGAATSSPQICSPGFTPAGNIVRSRWGALRSGKDVAPESCKTQKLIRQMPVACFAIHSWRERIFSSVQASYSSDILQVMASLLLR